MLQSCDNALSDFCSLLAVDRAVCRQGRQNTNLTPLGALIQSREKFEKNRVVNDKNVLFQRSIVDLGERSDSIGNNLFTTDFRWNNKENFYVSTNHRVAV